MPKSTLDYWLRELLLSQEKILELWRKGWSKGEASREKFLMTMRNKRKVVARKIYDEQKKRLLDLSRKLFL